MKASKLPKTDSIQELARFWDSHDLSDFENELTETDEPVFAKSRPIQLRLPSSEARRVKKIAESKGISQAELVHQWVAQKLAGRKRPNHAKG